MALNDEILPTRVKDAVKKLEIVANADREQVNLTKNGIKLLTEALRDLGQRTSGIEILPDGRAKLGLFTYGHPIIVLREHHASRRFFAMRDYRKAFAHAVNAVSAYERSKKREGCILSGRLTNHAIGKLYYLAGLSAQRTHNKQFAYLYAKKSTEAESNAKNIALLSTTLANLGAIEDAIEYIRRAQKKDPANKKYLRLEKAYFRRM